MVAVLIILAVALVISLLYYIMANFIPISSVTNFTMDNMPKPPKPQSDVLLELCIEREKLVHKLKVIDLKIEHMNIKNKDIWKSSLTNNTNSLIK